VSQSAQLADQIRRAFDGEAWHGDSVLEILADLDAATAAAHPIEGAHSVWELVLHIACWDEVTIQRAGGKAVMPSEEQNFPPVKDTSEAAWKKAVEQLKSTHRRLVETVAAFPDARLQEQIPGKAEEGYDFYHLFSGIVQHELYHAGQIALLKKA
jgi:uncharacterized damage-inducible protein DinB